MIGSLVSAVEVDDHEVDAALYHPPHSGGALPVLVLSPHPSFSTAVTAIQTLLPTVTHDAAQAVVRQYLPGAMRMDDFLPMIGVPAVSASPVVRMYQMDRTWLPTQVWAVCALVAALLVFGFVLVHESVPNHWGISTAPASHND